MLAGLGLWRALRISRISSVGIRNESSSTEMGSIRCFALLLDPSCVHPSSGLNHAPSYNAWALCSQEENLALTLSRHLVAGMSTSCILVPLLLLALQSPMAFLLSSHTVAVMLCSGLAEDTQSSAMVVVSKPAERLPGSQRFIQSYYPMDLGEVSTAVSSVLLQSMGLGYPFLGASLAFSQCQPSPPSNTL